MSVMNENDRNMESRILSCAENLFLSKGYNSTSMTEIAKDAGCTQALVHYYFRTKENLFSKIFSDKMELFIRGIVDAADEKFPFLEMLRVRVGRLFDLMKDNPSLAGMLFYEMGENPVWLFDMKEYLVSSCTSATLRFGELIDAEVRAGRIRKTDVMHLTLDIFSLVVPFFMFLPFLEQSGIVPKEELEDFVSKRRSEIIETVIRSLRP